MASRSAGSTSRSAAFALSWMLGDPGRPRDRQHVVAEPEQPGEQELVGARAVLGGELPQDRMRCTGPVPDLAADRVPGDVGHVHLAAALDQAAVDIPPRPGVALVLEALDPGLPLRPFELLGIEVRHADVRDLARLLQVAHRAYAVLDRHVLVRGVQLVEGDGLHPEPLETAFAGALDVLGPPASRPGTARPEAPHLGRHRHLAGVSNRVEGLADQALVVAEVTLVETVGVGGVDEVHAPPSTARAITSSACSSEGRSRWRGAMPRSRWGGR